MIGALSDFLFVVGVGLLLSWGVNLILSDEWRIVARSTADGTTYYVHAHRDCPYSSKSRVDCEQWIGRARWFRDNPGAPRDRMPKALRFGYEDQTGEYVVPPGFVYDAACHWFKNHTTGETEPAVWRSYEDPRQ